MSRPAIITTPELQRYAKIARETGLPVTIEVAGRRITIGGPQPPLANGETNGQHAATVDVDL